MLAELVGTYVLVFMGRGAAVVNRTHPLTTVGMAMMTATTLASPTLRLLFQDNINVTVTLYSDSTTHLQALVWEFIATFILMFTICGVATDHRASKNLSGVAIGVTVLFNATVAGPVIGASMNPARSFGPAVVTGIYKNLWVYLSAPILGALAATALYSVLRVSEPVKSDPNDKTLPPV